ncbi:hypothetical protein RvY_18612 [Ramazzottius varieornatus]|uniref:Protein amnionless n=1 Tax=Ramazzottius varieornatus TaxID=947166 RepID=A0A1D1W6E6_RAMVA|nr:hypothetical protein RvY_18612 [Ramazzottius varieornatus]
MMEAYILRFLVIPFLYVISLGKTEALLRVWTPHASVFEEVKTWHDGRKPCYGDSIRLQENRAVLVSQHHTLGGLSLPNRGELIMAEGAVLDIIDLSEASEQQKRPAQESCPGSVGSARSELLVDVQAPSWFDPDNWELRLNTSTYKKLNLPFLDSQRIPCNGDDVEIPAGHSFQIGMPASLKEPIRLRSFKIGHLAFTNEMLAEYFTRPDPNSLFDIADRTISTETGTMVEDVETLVSGPFIRLGEAFLSGWAGCSTQHGCVCGNDRKEVMGQICKFEAQSSRTPEVMQCCNGETAINVPGHCSPLCASVVQSALTDATNALKAAIDMQDILEDLKDDDSWPKYVSAYISVTHDNKLQTILFTNHVVSENETHNGVPHRIAAEILIKRLALSPNQRWFDRSMMSLVSSATDPSKTEFSAARGGNMSTAGTTVGIVVGVLLLLVLIAALIFVVVRYRRRLPFAFRAFDNNSDNQTIEMDEGPNFVNPLYSQDAGSGDAFGGDADYNSPWDIEEAADHNNLSVDDDDHRQLAQNEF